VTFKQRPPSLTFAIRLLDQSLITARQIQHASRDTAYRGLIPYLTPHPYPLVLPSTRWPVMAGPQNRKRQHANHLSQDNHVKKKTRSSAECPNFSPQFWDSLSRVPLTARALRELDRRNNIQPPPKLEGPRKLHSGNLARFARRGGPDLRHLRGVRPHIAKMTDASDLHARLVSRAECGYKHDAA
jgi:hypothetical protein